MISAVISAKLVYTLSFVLPMGLPSLHTDTKELPGRRYPSKTEFTAQVSPSSKADDRISALPTPSPSPPSLDTDPGV
ncbi:hypothetical protein ACOMHN_038082 [Nucella lapillus]